MFPPRPRRPARRATAPRRRRHLDSNKITGTIPPQLGQLTALPSLRVPPRPRRPARRATAPRRRRRLHNNQLEGTFPSDLCGLGWTRWGCNVKFGNDLVAPCGTSGCCDLDDGETCSSSGGGDACSGLAKKTCKKTAGCAYKKKTCISCSELSKKKCKKTDGCDYKKKQCSAASSCSGLSKNKCKETDGCKYKKEKDKCLAK